jgi:two-component system chemotaxis response regulator CheB
MINVLIVDDSKIIREQLTYVIEKDSDIMVIGIAVNGKDAIAQVGTIKPDVVLMDIHMPDIDGFEATAEIMSKTPVPIIIITCVFSDDDIQLSYKAMEAGALMIVEKPHSIDHIEHDKEVSELIKYIKLMSEIKTVRKWRNKEKPLKIKSNLIYYKNVYRKINLIAIGASTGGPTVIERILESLPSDLPVPIVIVQHMATGFIESFVRWLNSKVDLTVKLAYNYEIMKPGVVYFSPDGYHIRVGSEGKILLSREVAINDLRPTVSKLFKSVSEVYKRNAIGVLLTGMGRDGANELKMMHDFGAMTIIQDEASCVVYGMPREAELLNCVDFILNPKQIAIAIKQVCV